MQNARLHFSKTFDARYISHLDLGRVFSRAIKMSGLDVWYTEGFNPHLYLAFAQALPLGFESICEVADIRLTGDDIDPYIKERINAGLPFGIEVFDAAQPVLKTGDIAFSRYLIELGDDAMDDKEIAAALASTLSLDSIPTQKRSKKGAMREIDVKPLVREHALARRGGVCLLDLVTAAGGERSLNPTILLECAFEALSRRPEHLLVKRVQLLTADMANFI